MMVMIWIWQDLLCGILVWDTWHTTQTIPLLCSTPFPTSQSEYCLYHYRCGWWPYECHPAWKWNKVLVWKCHHDWMWLCWRLIRNRDHGTSKRQQWDSSKASHCAIPEMRSKYTEIGSANDQIGRHVLGNVFCLKYFFIPGLEQYLDSLLGIWKSNERSDHR